MTAQRDAAPESDSPELSSPGMPAAMSEGSAVCSGVSRAPKSWRRKFRVLLIIAGSRPDRHGRRDLSLLGAIPDFPVAANWS